VYKRQADTYPVVATNKDGDPALIVSTDGEYSYVGQLVVDFNGDGILVDANECIPVLQ